jgi:serine/threonine protein kinase
VPTGTEKRGVTLYELLTLEPAFGGRDREELLRQIAFEEPAAPRKLNRAVPAELETILLKAVEKNPADRYGTVQELADDLRRRRTTRPRPWLPYLPRRLNRGLIRPRWRNYRPGRTRTDAPSLPKRPSGDGGQI